MIFALRSVIQDSLGFWIPRWATENNTRNKVNPKGASKIWHRSYSEQEDSPLWREWDLNKELKDFRLPERNAQLTHMLHVSLRFC